MSDVLQNSWIGIAHDIRNIAVGGSSNDDSRISLRHIMWLARTTFSSIIADEIEKKSLGIINYQIDDNLFNDLGCVPLIEVDPSECGCYVSGCTILRTPKVPQIMSLLGKLQIKYVGGIDKQTPFYKTTPQNVKGLKQNRFSTNNTYWWWSDDYIYVVTPVVNSILSCINIQALTSDPMAVMPQCGSNGNIITPCYDIFSTEAPIPEKYIRMIRQEILSKELNIMLGVPKDKINDGSDSTNKNG